MTWRQLLQANMNVTHLHEVILRYKIICGCHICYVINRKMAATGKNVEDYLTQKSLWWYRHILDTDGRGMLTKHDFDCSALKYAILYCKGDMIKEFCDMFLNVFNQLWVAIKSAGGESGRSENVNFKEFRALIVLLSQEKHKYEELPEFLQKLIDMLFVSYDTKGDNGIDEDEYRLYLCARNMDMKRATECFIFMTGDSRGKIKKPQFRQLMFDFLTSTDPNSEGRYICGPFDSAKKDALQHYFVLACR